MGKIPLRDALFTGWWLARRSIDTVERMKAFQQELEEQDAQAKSIVFGAAIDLVEGLALEFRRRVFGLADRERKILPDFASRT